MLRQLRQELAWWRVIGEPYLPWLLKRWHRWRGTDGFDYGEHYGEILIRLIGCEAAMKHEAYRNWKRQYGQKA